MVYNGSGNVEGKDLKDKIFNITEMLNRSINDCLIENPLLLVMPR